MGQNRGMTTYPPFDRDQPFLLPPGRVGGTSGCGSSRPIRTPTTTRLPPFGGGRSAGPGRSGTPAYEATQAAHKATQGSRGRPPKPPDETPPPNRQSNLSDPDSQLMGKSKAHEYRQAYNPQAVVCADGSQLILATNMATAPSDQPTFLATILAMEQTIGLPPVVLAEAALLEPLLN
jgi:hypothetical protein